MNKSPEQLERESTLKSRIKQDRETVQSIEQQLEIAKSHLSENIDSLITLQAKG